jgi:hypothetical protein
VVVAPVVELVRGLGQELARGQVPVEPGQEPVLARVREPVRAQVPVLERVLGQGRESGVPDQLHRTAR